MADISKITTLDGTTYNIKDTTARNGLPSAMTESEATTGTGTTARTISPVVLKTAIQAHGYWQYNSTTDSIDLVFPS